MAQVRCLPSGLYVFLNYPLNELLGLVGPQHDACEPDADHPVTPRQWPRVERSVQKWYVNYCNLQQC